MSDVFIRKPMFRIAQPTLPNLTAKSVTGSQQSKSAISSLRKTCAQFHVKESERVQPSLKKNPSQQNSLKSHYGTNRSHQMLYSVSNSPINQDDDRSPTVHPVSTTSIARSYTSQSKTMFDDQRQRSINTHKSRETDRNKRRSSNTYRNLKNKAMQDWINQDISASERKEIGTQAEESIKTIEPSALSSKRKVVLSTRKKRKISVMGKKQVGDQNRLLRGNKEEREQAPQTVIAPTKTAQDRTSQKYSFMKRESTGQTSEKTPSRRLTQDVSRESIQNLKHQLNSLFYKEQKIKIPSLKKSRSGIDLLKRIHQAAPSYFFLGEQMSQFPQERRTQPYQVQEYKKTSQFMNGSVIQDALRGQSVSSYFKSVNPQIPESDAPRDFSKNLLEKVAPFESVQLKQEGFDEQLIEPKSQEQKAVEESQSLLSKPLSRKTVSRIQSRAANLSQVLLSTQDDSKRKMTLNSSQGQYASIAIFSDSRYFSRKYSALEKARKSTYSPLNGHLSTQFNEHEYYSTSMHDFSGRHTTSAQEISPQKRNFQSRPFTSQEHVSVRTSLMNPLVGSEAPGQRVVSAQKARDDRFYTREEPIHQKSIQESQKQKSHESSLFRYSRGSTLLRSKSKERYASGRTSKKDLLRMEEELSERVENDLRIKEELHRKKNSIHSSIYHELEEEKTIQKTTIQSDQLIDAPNHGEVLLKLTPMLASEERIASLRTNITRKYLLSELERFFDPFRLKVRVFSTARARIVGKNADYFFVEGVKRLYEGKEDYHEAYRLFRRGLSVKEDHLFCKFNLGVVLFKLGLFIDSYREYEELSQLYPTNSWVFYNMSVCLIQKGKFNEAIQVINKALQLSFENDFAYRFDIFQLRGVCWFRLGELKNAVADFLKANNIKSAAGYHWNQAQIEQSPNQENSISREDSLQHSMAQSRQKFQTLSQESGVQNDQLEPLLVNKDQEYGMITADRIQDREKFKSQISAISQTLVVEKDEEMGFKVMEKKASRSGSTSVQRRRSLGAQRAGSNVISQDLLSPQGSQVRREFRPFMPRLGTDERSAMQRLDAKFAEMKGLHQKSSRKKVKEQVEQNEEDIVRENSEKSTDKNIKAKIYGNKYAETKNYFFIDGNRNLRLEKVLGLEKEGLTPDEIAERKRRILTMKEQLSDEEQESLEEELQALERPLTTDENFQTPGREEKHPVLQSQLYADESYHEMKNEDQFDYLDKQFDNLARKLEEHQSPQKQKVPEEPMFANRVISDLTGKKMKKMMSKLIRNQEKLQVGGYKKSNDLLTQFNLEMPVLTNPQEQGGQLENMKKCLIPSSLIFQISKCPQQQLFDRDIKAIEHETKYLKFFHRFPKDVRMKIFMKCDYHHFKKDEFIFKQNERGDKLYIILSGSVKVLMKKDIFGDQPIVVATLYDGMQFGELAIFSGLQNNEDVTEEQQDQSQLRKASCQACEDLDCISLDKDVSQRILHFQMQKNFSDKLDLLKRVKILKGIQPIHLIPMASNLQAEYYTFGEYIVKEGERPRGFYIISRGQCRVVSTRMARRPQDDSKAAQRHNHSKIEKIPGKQPLNSQRLATFHKEVPTSIFELLEMQKVRGSKKQSGRLEGFMKKSAAEIKMVDRTVFSLQHNNSKKRAFQNERLYADQFGNPYDCEIVYNDLMDFGRLLPGESFGARILLTDEIVAAAQNVAKRQLRMIAQSEAESKKRKLEKAISHSQRQAITDEDNKIKKESLLSIIADSDLVEVYVIDKSQLGLLSEEVMEQMARIILTTNEPDRPDLPEILRSQKESYEKWDKYKVKLMQGFMKEQSQERNKHKNLSLNR